MSRPLTWYRLRFPRDVSEDAALAALAALSGISRATRLVLDVTATHGGIAHHLGVARSGQGSVSAAMRAALPSLRLEPIDPPSSVAGRRVRWQLKPGAAVIRSDELSSISAALLASLFPLAKDEVVRLTWTLRPTPRPRRLAATPEEKLTGRIRALRTKLALPGLGGYGDLTVHAAEPARVGALMNRTAAVLRSLNTPHGRLVADGRAWATVTWLSGWRGRYFSVRELLAVIGWPVGSPSLPGLQLGSARRLVPSPALARTGRIIGLSNYPGVTRPVAIGTRASTRHLWLLGPTGTGKTTLITNLVVQSMAAGQGLALVDTNGDLSRSLLDVVPESRLDDIVYVDPSDSHPVGLNPLALTAGTGADLTAERLVEVFARVWHAYWGPRSALLFHLGLSTLARQQRTTLVDLTRLFSDPAYRAAAVGRLDDPIGLEPTWAWFESLSFGEQTSMLGPVFNKVRAFTGRKIVRNIIGQAEPRITLAQVMTENKILIVNLAKGLLGQEAARLLGALVVTGLWQAATARAALPAARRPVFNLYLDELQDLLAVPIPFDEMLSQGRKYGLALNLAHQNLGQLTPEIRDAILANAASKIAFRVPASDAGVLARTFEPALTASDLQALDPYEAAAIIGLDEGGSAPPVTIQTTLPVDPLGTEARVLRLSRRHFGRAQEEIEAELRATQTPTRPPAAPVGRKRRTTS